MLPVARRDVTDLYTTLMEGERERREVMWQMVHEIVRLGEAIDRQHAILGGIVDQLVERTDHALPAARPAATTADRGAERAAPLTPALETLQDELARERELVERLRRSKLDLERRAAEAETLLESLQQRRPGGSIFARLRSRHIQGEGG